MLYLQAEAKSKFPTEWREHIENPHYQIPNGESYAQFIQRTTSALEDIRRKHAGQTICVVTHGGVIDCLRNYLVTVDDGMGREARCGNGSISELIGEENGVWRLAKWNDCSHMASLHKPILVADDVTSTNRRRNSLGSSKSS